jgi:ABC-2 type transport system permease protein
MRLFSEEYKLKTIEPLLTAPVRDIEVVLAKFFAVVCLYALMFLPLLSYFYFFEQITGMPAADSPSAYIGAITIFLLSGMFYLSTGCFASAIARNQVVAGAVGLIIVTLFFFISFLVHVEWEVVSEFREVISYISTIEHVRDFSRGIFDTRPFVYYLSMTVFMLVLTTQVFQHHKWKS